MSTSEQTQEWRNSIDFNECERRRNILKNGYHQALKEWQMMGLTIKQEMDGIKRILHSYDTEENRNKLKDVERHLVGWEDYRNKISDHISKEFGIRVMLFAPTDYKKGLLDD